MDDHIEYLTLHEVAEAVKVSETTVRRWDRSGDLPAFKVGDRGQIRVHPAELRAFMERSRVDPQQPEQE